MSTRITVRHALVRLMKVFGRVTFTEVLAACPDLTSDDVLEALEFAHSRKLLSDGFTGKIRDCTGPVVLKQQKVYQSYVPDPSKVIVYNKDKFLDNPMNWFPEGKLELYEGFCAVPANLPCLADYRLITEQDCDNAWLGNL